ncbi:MAG: SprT family zinc-dependent metalloprotease [Balneolales bacterium]
MKHSFNLHPDLPEVSVVQRIQQRTMRIRIKDDQIIVSGPASVSRTRLLNFVREKSKWIHKTWDKRLRRRQYLEQQRRNHRGTLLLRGERKPVHPVADANQYKPKLIEKDRIIAFHFNPKTNTDRPDLNTIHSFYLKIAKAELHQQFDYWSERLPYRPGKMIIRNQKTKWGSCSTRQTISLNWRLIKCPPNIVDYIIIHELCHLKYFNHSAAFWQLVSQYYPQQKEARTWIRTHTDEIFSDS